MYATTKIKPLWHFTWPSTSKNSSGWSTSSKNSLTDQHNLPWLIRFSRVTWIEPTHPELDTLNLWDNLKRWLPWHSKFRVNNMVEISLSGVLGPVLESLEPIVPGNGFSLSSGHISKDRWLAVFVAMVAGFWALSESESCLIGDGLSCFFWRHGRAGLEIVDPQFGRSCCVWFRQFWLTSAVKNAYRRHCNCHIFDRDVRSGVVVTRLRRGSLISVEGYLWGNQT